MAKMSEWRLLVSSVSNSSPEFSVWYFLHAATQSQSGKTMVSVTAGHIPTQAIYNGRLELKSNPWCPSEKLHALPIELTCPRPGPCYLDLTENKINLFIDVLNKYWPKQSFFKLQAG